MYPIVMLVGQAGSGKDTIADMLIEEHAGAKLSLANPIKAFARQIFWFSNDQLWGPSQSRNAEDRRWNDREFRAECTLRFENSYHQWATGLQSGSSEALRHWYYSHVMSKSVLTPRHVLQTLGTEWGREQSKDIWIDYALQKADQLLDGGDSLVVIPDGRFRNEALKVLRKGGILIKIVNPEGPTISSTHQSESESATIPDCWFYDVYVNHKDGLAQLRSDVSKWSLQ